VLQALASSIGEDDLYVLLRSYVTERIARIELSPLAQRL
jgi:hypothetical protein